MQDKNLITVTVKSFISPLNPMEGFRLGESFEMTIPGGMTLGELTRKLLRKNVNQIGIMAVNGKVALEDATLSAGDKIDLYSLLNGG
jgi:sulfur carrier protein ThiS